MATSESLPSLTPSPGSCPSRCRDKGSISVSPGQTSRSGIHVQSAHGTCRILAPGAGARSGPGRARTDDTRGVNAVLYQLSYRPPDDPPTGTPFDRPLWQGDANAADPPASVTYLAYPRCVTDAAAHPSPVFVRPRPFERGDFGIDEDAVPAGTTLREFVSIDQAWGRTLELQARSADDPTAAWEPLHAIGLNDDQWGGGWFETAPTDQTSAITYRYRIPATDTAPEVLSQERTLRFVNPEHYDGLAAQAYELIRPIRPQTVIDVVSGMPHGTMGGDSLAVAHVGYDRIELSDALAEGGAAHGDLKAVVLHELGHLRQYDVYPDPVTGTTEMTKVFGPNLPLELAANCLMEHWGGLGEGAHFDYCDSDAARAAVEAIAAGRPYYVDGPPPTEAPSA